MGAIQPWVVYRYVHNYRNGICKHIYIGALKRKKYYKIGARFNCGLICGEFTITAPTSITRA